jgi:hypothetical protein
MVGATMATEKKVKQCMSEESFKVIDDIHCNIEDGAVKIDAHVKALRGGKKKGIQRSIDFLQGGIDSINSGMGRANALNLSGFISPHADNIREETIKATKMLMAARKTGVVTPETLTILEDIARRAKHFEKITFDVRVSDLFNCLVK